VSTLEEVVKVEEVRKDFRPGLGLRRKRVLHGISLTVRRGELFGFVGPNGAGKTTTLKILMGLIRADGGRAEILGHDVRDPEARRQIGFLPESSYFYDYLTGRELLDFYARVSGVADVQRRARVDALLEQVGLAHARDARLRTYSKGMLQRIGIAQAIVHDPAIVFLDEPMSGLDPIGRKEIRDLVARLHAEGKTIFMNTHILADVELLCDRVAIVVEGRIRFQGSVHDMMPDGRRQTDVVLGNVDPELIEEVEQRLGVPPRGTGARVEFRVDEKDASQVLALALARHAEVHAVTPHRPSLESIFLDAVHGSGTAAPEERA
jgi:ABC-2 type transport system ATP-binding protein